VPGSARYYAIEGAPRLAHVLGPPLFTEVLLEKLRPLGARDHVDVDSFMHVVRTKHTSPKPQLRPVT
jgi:hypothetical protein